tara:strand:- start:11 stop:1573 length:1563 start_codon:yes stop_codon:yes gene_type:complete
MSRNHDNFADLITFTRASRGTSVRHVRYGNDLVTEGSHTSIGSDWSFSSGVYSCSGGQTSGQTIVRFSNIGIVQGSQYFISLQVSNLTTGSLGVKLNGTSSESAASNGTFNFTIVGVDNDGFQLVEQSSFDGDVSNISVKKVTLDDTADPLLIFNHADNIPRIDFDPVTNDRKGFLIEESRTNVLTESEDFSGYSKTQTAIFSNEGTAPDGTNNATKLVEAAGSSFHIIKEVSAFSYTSGDTYTHSAFLKAGTVSVMQLSLPGGAFGSNGFANFDLANGVLGTVGSSATASIEGFGNGWFRCVVTATATATSSEARGTIIFTNNSTTAGRLPTYAGDTANHVFIFGNQLEEGAFPTSYIPTSGASATRAADAASIATSAFGYNQDEGTIVAEAQTFKADLFHRVASLNDGTSINRIILQANAGTHLFVEVDDVSQTSRDAGAYTSNVFTKHAAAFQENNFGACLDGGSVSTGASGTLPVANILNIGAAVTGTFGFLNGHIKKLQYFPRRLSDTQLQEITR